MIQRVRRAQRSLSQTIHMYANGKKHPRGRLLSSPAPPYTPRPNPTSQILFIYYCLPSVEFWALNSLPQYSKILCTLGRDSPGYPGYSVHTLSSPGTAPSILEVLIPDVPSNTVYFGQSFPLAPWVLNTPGTTPSVSGVFVPRVPWNTEYLRRLVR